MSGLSDYISSLTGKEVDAAVLAILGKFVQSFNGRGGFNITPKVNDYSTDLIKNTSTPPEDMSILQGLNNLTEVLNKIYDILKSNCFHRDWLWGDKTIINGVHELDKPWVDYDILEFWISQGGAGSILTEENFTTFLSVPFIKTMPQTVTYPILIPGYASEYQDIRFPDDTHIQWVIQTSQAIYRIYGIKFGFLFD